MHKFYQGEKPRRFLIDRTSQWNRIHGNQSCGYTYGGKSKSHGIAHTQKIIIINLRLHLLLMVP